MADSFDLESLVSLEQQFYDEGYKDGYNHGRIHGLIEGRALGREKGFEMWEELGFYEGFAMTSRAIYAKEGRADDRAMHHVQHLLELIAKFPRHNPSADSHSGAELDISKLLSQIRSRYKAACSGLGMRPSLRANDDGHQEEQEQQGGNRRQNVWQLHSDSTRPPAGTSLSF